MSGQTAYPLSETVLAIGVADAATAQALATQLRATGDWLEVVAGLDSVAAAFNTDTMAVAGAAQLLEAAARSAPPPLSESAPPLEITVRYGGDHGPDLADTCARLGLDEAGFIARHTAPLYTAEMIGFTPGFAYLSGLDPVLSMPRLARPRLRVPAGSVGISGAYSGLYALPGPGGWPLIGRTDAALFSARRDDPFLIHPGRAIRFVPA